MLKNAKDEQISNLSFEVLSNRKVLKSLFLKSDKKDLKFHIKEINTANNDEKKKWFDGHIKKVKENLIYNSISSELIKSLMGEKRNSTTSINYYKKYLKVHDDFDSRNFDHLQILRINYILSCHVSNTNKTQTDSRLTIRNPQIPKLFEAYLTVESNKSSSTYVLTVITANISLFMSSELNYEIAIQSLKNLVLEFNCLLSKKDKTFLSQISFEVTNAIESNMICLIELIEKKIIRSESYNFVKKSEIFMQILLTLKFFKSQNVILRLFVLLQEFKFSYDSKIIQNLLSETFNLECSSMFDAIQKKNCKLLNEIQLACFDIIHKMKIVADDTFYYIFANNTAIKIGQGYNNSISNQIYNQLNYLPQNYNIITPFVILKKNFIYSLLYDEEKKKFKYFIIDKISFRLVSDSEVDMRIQTIEPNQLRIVNNDNYFFIIYNINLNNKDIMVHETTGNSGISIILNRIKAKKYRIESLSKALSLERSYKILNFPEMITLYSGQDCTYFLDKIQCSVGRNLFLNFSINLDKQSKNARIIIHDKLDVTDSFSAYYNKLRNEILVVNVTNKNYVEIQFQKVLNYSPYEYNYLSKSFILEEIFSDAFDIKFCNTSENENASNVNVSKLICCLNSYKKDTSITIECYKLFQYNLVNYLLNSANSALFNHNGEENSIKFYTTPYSFAFDWSVSIFKYTTGKLNRDLNFENLSHLIILKNYLNNLLTMGVDVNLYLKSTISDNSTKQLVDTLTELLLLTKSTSQNKYSLLIFNEILDIFKLLINQNYPFDINVIKNLVYEFNLISQKLKILSAYIDMINEKKFKSDFHEFFSYVIQFEKDLILGVLRDQSERFIDDASRFTNQFKDIFLQYFTVEIMTGVTENSEEFDKILEIVIKELIGVISLIIPEILLYSENSISTNELSQRLSNLWHYIEINSIIFNVSYLLIQVLNTKLLNNLTSSRKRSLDSKVVRMYLKLTLNLYIELKKLTNCEGNKPTNCELSESDYEFESEHALSNGINFHEIIKFYSNISSDIPRSIEFDILSQSDNLCIEAVNKNVKNLKFSKPLPVDPINLEGFENEIDISIKYSPKIDLNSSNEENNFFLNYGYVFNIGRLREKNFLMEFRRSVLYSINKIIADNLGTSEETNNNKETNYSLYKSVFNSKLLKNISLDSNMLVNSENIKYLNEVIESIHDESLRKDLFELFWQCHDQSDNVLIRTYSMEPKIGNTDLCENILNSQDEYYIKGIKFLQKMLQRKAPYLPNLAGGEVDKLVLYLFVIILKYQNLISFYTEKFLVEINSETQNKVESSSPPQYQETFIKIWTECSKIRIWIQEKKKILGELLDKEDRRDSFDSEFSSIISNLIDKAKFFLSIIIPKHIDKELLNVSNEIVDSLIVCMKSEELSLDKFTERINLQNEKGINREYALILLNALIYVVGGDNETDLNDIIFNFNKYTRNEEMVVNLIDDIIGADCKVITRISNQFHLLIENFFKIWSGRSNRRAITDITLLQSFIWKIKGRDYPILKTINKILESLPQDQGPNTTRKNTSKFGVSEISKGISTNIFNELFEIYSLQIFRKLNLLNLTQEATLSKPISVLNLSRSQSNVSDDDSRKMIEFVLNVMINTFNNFNDVKKIKNNLLLLYRCIGYNTSMVGLVMSVSPNIFPILLGLFDHKNCTVEIKLLLIKIYHQFIISFNNIDIDILNYSLRMFFTENEKITCENVFSNLLDYFYTLISVYKFNKNIFLFSELTTTFRQFFSLHEPFKSHVNSFIMKKLNTEEINTLLLIFGVELQNGLVIGAPVLVNLDLKSHSNRDLDFSSKDEYSENSKLGRIVGYISDKNPFEYSSEIFECNEPNLRFQNLDHDSEALVVLEESLISIKETNYNIIKISCSKLIPISSEFKRIQECSKTILECKVIDYLIDSIILKREISSECKYLTLKFISLAIESKELLEEIFSNNPKNIIEFLINLCETKNINEDVNINFLSLEILENILTSELLCLKIDSNGDESSDLPTISHEFFEDFVFSFGLTEIFISYKNRTNSVNIIISANNESKPLLTYITSKLSIYKGNSNSNYNILNSESIMFIDNDILIKESVNINSVILSHDIKCIITNYDGLTTMSEAYSIPILFLEKFNYYSLVTYFFTAQIDANLKFDFHYLDYIRINGSEPVNLTHLIDVNPHESLIQENYLNPDSMLFFPGCENDNVSLRINDDNFEKYRNPNILRSNITSLKHRFTYLGKRLSSLISRRIILKIIQHNNYIEYIDPSYYQVVLRIYNLLTHEYLYNSTCLSKYSLELKSIKNLLRDFLLSSKCLGILEILLDTENIIDLKFNSHIINILPKKTEEFFIENNYHCSLEIKLKTIMFILENQIDSLDSAITSKCLVDLIKKLVLLSNDFKDDFILGTLSNLSKFIYHRILDGDRNVIDYIRKLNCNFQNCFLSWGTVSTLTKYSSKIINFDEKCKIIENECTRICEFLFTYFDICLTLLLRYNIFTEVSMWILNKNEIFDFYFNFNILNRKFKYSSKDYFEYLTLMHGKNILLGLEDESYYKEISNDHKSTVYEEIEINHKCVVHRKQFKSDFLDKPGVTNIKIQKKKTSPGVDSTHDDTLLIITDKNNNFVDYIADVENNYLKWIPYNNEDELHLSVISTNTNSSSNNFKHSLYSFGKNDYGVLSCGGDDGKLYHTPQKCIGLDENVNIKSFKYGFHHIFVLDYDGTLYVAGKSEGSSLANPSPSFTKNNKLNEIASKEGGVKEVYVNNYDSTIILTNSNKLYGCGVNHCGILSTANAEGSRTSVPFEIISLPDKVQSVALGFKNSLVILENGEAYTLGENKFHQCGDLTSKDTKLNWFKLPIPVNCRRFLSAAAGEEYFLLLIEDLEGKSRLYSMGSYTSGKTGVGKDVSGKLQKCHGVEFLEFKLISTRNNSSAAVTVDGKLYTFGDNTNFSLGLNLKSFITPTLVDFFIINNFYVESVTIGANHMLVIARGKVDGNTVRKVFSCGINETGILGFDNLNSSSNVYKIPKEVTFFTDNSLIPIKVICSKFQSYVLTLNKNFNIINEKCDFYEKLNSEEHISTNPNNNHIYDYNITLSCEEKFEDKLRSFFNSRYILKLFELIKNNLNISTLTEFSELRDDYLLSNSNIKEPESIEIRKHLQSKYMESRNFEKIKLILNLSESDSNKLLQMMNLHLSKINSEMFQYLGINLVSENKNLFNNCILENSEFISTKLRLKIFYEKLEPTLKSSSCSSVSINRFKARNFYKKNSPDITGEETIFGQMFTKLKSWHSNPFRGTKDSRLFKAELVGEGATDYGGPYRDVFYSVCEELQSSSLDLFIKTPNNKSELGAMRDRYILNPSANLEIHYEMFKFLGKLMANSLCTGNILNLSIHPIIWKSILNSEIKFTDYETVDSLFYKLITSIEDGTSNKDFVETFEEFYSLNFSIQISNGNEIELIKNGKQIPVNGSNITQFISLAKSSRCEEFNVQVKCIREGLNDVVPVSYLSYLTWRELEYLICGKPNVNLATLKNKTRYSSYKVEDTVIVWFWEVLDEFTDEEKVLYLKYVWGRSRLPDPELFPFEHVIQKQSCSNPNIKFPSATTCYFTLNLPLYSTKEVLREKLKYSIINCNEIDADYAAREVEIII